MKTYQNRKLTGILVLTTTFVFFQLFFGLGNSYSCGGTEQACGVERDGCSADAGETKAYVDANAHSVWDPLPCKLGSCGIYLDASGNILESCSAPIQNCGWVYTYNEDGTIKSQTNDCIDVPNPCLELADACIANAANTCSVMLSQQLQSSLSTYTNSIALCNKQYDDCVIPCKIITATAGENGHISPSGSVPVQPGGRIDFSISPNWCYHVSDVRVDNTSVGAVTSYSFYGVNKDYTIDASFEINTYTITATVVGGVGGTITPSTGIFTCDSSKTFTITPNSCYHIVDVEVDGVSKGAINSYPFPSITGNHTIKATFSDKYGVTALKQSTNTGKGTVFSSPAGITCGPNCMAQTAQFNQACSSLASTVTLTAAPDSDSSFANWSGSCAGTQCVMTMDGEKQSIAAFKILPPLAAFTASSTAGSIPLPVNFTNQSLRAWDVSRTTAPWADTYTWTFGDGETSNEKEPHHVYKTVGTFVVTLTVKNPSGTSTKSANITVASCLNRPIRVMHPNNVFSGYFASLQDAYNSATSGDSIQSLAFNFVGDLHANGAKEVAISGGYSCDYQSQVGSSSLQGMFTVSDGMATMGNFELVTGPGTSPVYVITSYANSGGSISPSGTVAVLPGGTAVYTLTPDAGNQILDLVVDGISLGGVGSYTLTNIQANHSVEAIFSRTLSVSKVGEGTGTITSANGGINCGDVCSAELETNSLITLSALADPYSTFVGWSGGGCSGTGPCSVAMTVNQNVTGNFSTNHARIAGQTPLYFDTLQAAYDAAPDGATILVRNLTLTEDLNTNSTTPKTITIEGGYGVGYVTKTGVTTMNGAITTTTGTVTISNFVLAK